MICSAMTRPVCWFCATAAPSAQRRARSPPKIGSRGCFPLADAVSAGQGRLNFLPPLDRHHHTRRVGGEHGADRFAVSIHGARFSTEGIKSAGASVMGGQLIRPNAVDPARQRGTGERGPPLILKVIAPNNRVIHRCLRARPSSSCMCKASRSATTGSVGATDRSAPSRTSMRSA
jgi:hypothetical protein